jgi:hypothetical protein
VTGIRRLTPRRRGPAGVWPCSWKPYAAQCPEVLRTFNRSRFQAAPVLVIIRRMSPRDGPSTSPGRHHHDLHLLRSAHARATGTSSLRAGHRSETRSRQTRWRESYVSSGSCRRTEAGQRRAGPRREQEKNAAGDLDGRTDEGPADQVGDDKVDELARAAHESETAWDIPTRAGHVSRRPAPARHAGTAGSIKVDSVDLAFVVPIRSSQIRRHGCEGTGEPARAGTRLSPEARNRLSARAR